MPIWERFIPPENDPSEGDSIEHMPSQQSMEEAYDSLGLATGSQEAGDDDGLAQQQFKQGQQNDLPKIIKGEGPYRKL